MAHIAFWVLLVWGKKEDDIGWLEAGIYVAIWGVVLALALTAVIVPVASLITTIVLDIILLFRCGIANAPVR